MPSTLDRALTLICSTTIVGVLYTFSFILYILCARLSYSWLRGPDGKRQTILTFSMATIIIICATMDVALSNQRARITFVDYSSLPGGPVGLSAQAHALTFARMSSLFNLIAEILSLGVLLWRVWVVYTGTRFAIPTVVLVSTIYLAYVVSKLVQFRYLWAPLAGALPNITRIVAVLAITTLSFTAASKILMTLMIIARLLFVRHKHIKVMGKTDIASQYLGIVAMVIESYALTTAWNIGELISYILRNPPAHNFFSINTTQIEILSYFLVLYRVFSGRAWNRQTQNQISSLRWDRRDIQSTNDNSGMGAVNTHASNAEVYLPAVSSRANV